MMGGVSLSSPSAQTPTTLCSSLQSRTNSYGPLMSPSSPSTILFKSPKFQSLRSQRIPLLCHSSTPGGPTPGDSGSRDVLDAFFLGKALAEAVSERLESTIGEFLSTVGRLQAEQQKQVQEFQEEVFERAKRAKEKAAQESFEAQTYISTSTAATKGQATNGVSSPSSPSTANEVTPVNSSPSSSLRSPDGDGPAVSVSNGD